MQPGPECGETGARLTWQRFGNATRHVRATCEGCGRFRGWVPQTPAVVAEAGAEPPPAPAAEPGGLFD